MCPSCVREPSAFAYHPGCFAFETEKHNIDMIGCVRAHAYMCSFASGGAGPGDTLALPTSDPNTAYYWQQKDALAASAPGGGGGAVQNLEPSRQLLQLARSIQAQEHKQVNLVGGESCI